MVQLQVIEEEGKSTKDVVTADIDTFEQWFRQTLGNADPLTRHERAIINDYIAYKTQVSK